MPTYNLRRFSYPEALKAVQPSLLLQLLQPHREFFLGRGLDLGVAALTDHDYGLLTQVLISPGADTPEGLSEALYFVHEMSDPPQMEELLAEAEGKGLVLNGSPDPTPMEIAVRVWLYDPRILQRKHAEQYLWKPRSFEYFQSESPAAFTNPNEETLVALQTDLDDWFEVKKRGRGSKVLAFPQGSECWLLVRHGEPYRREGSVDDSGEASSVFYRPEKYDVVVYNSEMKELRIHAGTKGIKELYRRKFGLHFFGNEDHFPGKGKYTLEPLRTEGVASLVCSDVQGLDWIKLREVQFFWGGPEAEIEIRRAKDLFAALETSGRNFPTRPRISRAKFEVKFLKVERSRMVTIRPSNIAQYTRDADSVVVEEWLTKRGFIQPGASLDAAA